jgi:plastocyanin
MVAVGRDQDEGFCSAVFLDASTSHEPPFRRVTPARVRRPALIQCTGRKGGAQTMDVTRLAIVLLLCGATAPARAQQVHQVKLIHAAGDLFRFEPTRINARPGEVLDFVVESGGPYVVGFEPQDLSAADRELLNSAIPARSGELRGPVLAGPGSRFRVAVPNLSPGSYRFASLTHLAYRMGGVLVIR